MDEWDAYFWPDSDVFKNIRGFRTADELKRFEYAATREASEELRRDPVQGRFDTAHYREIHRRLFHKVYEWAGEFRKVEFTKGDSSFAPLKTHAHTLESWTDKILGNLAAENHLKGLQKTAFVDRLTHHYNEINWVHAFREGNGRATKEFLYQLGKQAGYEIEYQRVSEKTWNAAAERLTSGTDPRLALDVFNKITTPSRALAFRDEHILDAVQRFPELRGAADALASAEQRALKLFEGVEDRRLFVAEIQLKLVKRLETGEIIPAGTLVRRKDDPKDPDFTR